MIRVLVSIAIAGFFVSIVTLSVAVAIGGPSVITDSAWGWGNHWSWNDRGWGSRSHHGGWDGPQATKDVAWTGGDSLDIDVPADVTYTQAPGPGKLTISGPRDALEALTVDGGHIGFDHHHGHWGDLTIVMTAPAVTHFAMNGSGKLAIQGYKQDKLALDLSGSADVTASGEAKSVALSASGSSDTDLSGLKVADAVVDLTGSGEAKLAATGDVNVNISGSGDVTLLGRPSKLQSSVSGSGSIHQDDAGPAPAPTPTPAPPAPPAKAGKKT
jgi:hypothetical protein